MHDQLDEAIRSVIADITAVAPESLSARRQAPLLRTRSRLLMPVMASLAVLLIVGLVALAARHGSPSTPGSSPAETTTSDLAPTAVPSSDPSTTSVSSPPVSDVLVANYPTLAAHVTSAQSTLDTAITIDHGSNDGIIVGMAVQNAGGLVGEIIEVTAQTSTVRLVTDPSFLIACTADDLAGGCAGTGGNGGVTIRSSSGGTPDAGAVVTTTGGPNSTAPAGIVIGRVVEPSSIGEVDLAADLGALDVVFVVRYVPPAEVPPGSSVVARPVIESLALGDSVMLGAANALPDQGVNIDAQASIQGSGMIDQLRADLATYDITESVIIQVGTNGTVTQEEYDEMAVLVADVPHVYFMTVKAPKQWIDGNNAIIRALPLTHPNVQIIDWEARSADIESELSPSDGGIHLNSGTAIRFYANLILSALDKPTIPEP